MFVAISQFAVANRMEDEVQDAFRHRPHAVDSAPGFVRMDVLRPRGEPECFWLITYWESEEAFEQWHRGHQYKEAHSGIPSGLKLVPGRNRVLHFDHIAS
jgi:heme oxygenase (mycobilin-producing)